LRRWARRCATNCGVRVIHAEDRGAQPQPGTSQSTQSAELSQATSAGVRWHVCGAASGSRTMFRQLASYTLPAAESGGGGKRTLLASREAESRSSEASRAVAWEPDSDVEAAKPPHAATAPATLDVPTAPEASNEPSCLEQREAPAGSSFHQARLA
jgi:hypothetical protein